MKFPFPLPAICLFVSIVFSCKENKTAPSRELINEINLKRGAIASCGPEEQQLGSVEFETSCKEEVKNDFTLAVKLLHSFEYDEAEKVFARVIDQNPECAMAYWGVAMSNFHPLWTPPSEQELKKGAKAIAIAASIPGKSKRESAYINSIAAYYREADKVDHRTRCVRFEKAMQELYMSYPDDREAAVFYALALDAAADPADKTFRYQKKAGTILNALYPGQPDHPGIVHYTIHTYDYPALAELALPAARKYASIAPSSAHALHMPSHIFTRLGLWDECIHSNQLSLSSAKCYAETAGIKGHWDEELHAMDYLVYAHLQKGENDLARKQLDELNRIVHVEPANFKVVYAFAAIPSRYFFENKMWKEAAMLEPPKANFEWKNFPWQKAIIHFTRLMGSVHTGRIAAAKAELNELNLLHDELIKQKDVYKANQVDIQIKSAEAWIQFKEGNNTEALRLMNLAADTEDKTEKHPVTPGEIVPARELLGDLLMQMKKPEKALEEYEASLQTHRNRFNGLYGAGQAAEQSGHKEKSILYYRQLLTIANVANSERPELPLIKHLVDQQP